MRVRQRHPHRGQGHVPLARRGDQRRAARRVGRDDAQPPLRQRFAGDRQRIAVHPARRRRDGSCRGRGEHEPRGVRQPHAALGHPDGRRQGHRHDGGRADRSVRYHSHGSNRGKRRHQMRHHPRAAGCLRRGEPQARGGGYRGGPIQGPDPTDRAEEQERARRVRHRRAYPRRVDDRRHGQAQSGLRQGERHRDGWERIRYQ